MQRCLALQKMYSDLKADLQQEIGIINNKIMKPVAEARAAVKPLQRTLKHRENMKLDHERYTSRAEHARRKNVRSPKEEAALAKHEGDLQQAEIDYQTADEQVKQTFPPVIEAVQALLPYIVEHQIRIQTTLVGQLYTSLDAYCKSQNLPSPAPSDAEIISVWDQQFTAFRKELEGGISVVAQGKAVHLAMNLPDKDTSTVTGLGIRNKSYGLYDKGRAAMPGGKKPPPPAPPTGPGASRANGNQLAITGPPADEEEAPPPKPPRPGQANMASSSPQYGASPIPSPARSPGLGVPFNSKPRMASNNYPSYDQKPSLMPTYPSHAPPSYEDSLPPTPGSTYHTPKNGLSRVTSSNDYFNNTGMPPLDRTKSSQSVASSVASIAAGKKKPPPPVPAKRMPSMQGTYVTALYDFDGQTPEDLPFREGDRIKVLRKTESTDDWWDGEVNGRKGSFPANYVQL